MSLLQKLAKRLFFLSFILAISVSVNAQTEGEQIFKSSGCTACHTIGGGKLVGPDLVGVQDRRSEDEIIKFVQNPGDFGITLMPPQSLDADEIKAVLSYIESYVPEVKEEVVTAVDGAIASEGMSNTTLLLIATFSTIGFNFYFNFS